MGVPEELRALVGELDSSIGVLERISGFYYDDSRKSCYFYMICGWKRTSQSSF